MAFIKQSKYILALSIILTLWTFQVLSRELHEEASSFKQHEVWMAKHGKVYQDTAEKEKRFQIFRENLGFIESFNAAGNKTYKLSINQFADLTNEEFKASLNGYKSFKPHGLMNIAETHFRYENATAIPATMDWRKRGAVTPIKNQGRCGCCWAFSTVAAVEGIHQITTGKLVSLSEQELVDCDTKGHNHGCNGGDMKMAFKFILKNGGITSEAKYPYKGVDGNCNTEKEAKPVVQIKGYERVPANSKEALLKAVANQPVSVSIDGGERDFQFYSSGIFTGDCGTRLDHAVTAIGYGTDEDGTKYWLLKNSWDTTWGEKGYMRLKRDVDSKKGLCGIAMDASYPIA